MIQPAALAAAGLSPLVAEVFAAPFANACRRFEVNTTKRSAALFGQCFVESGAFRQLEENLRYRADQMLLVFPDRIRSRGQADELIGHPEAFANVVYSGKNGNGDFASGDGWRYRGRGLIQTTGRGNYEAASKGCARPYVEQPDLLSQPSDACLSAGFFWSSNGLNGLADAWDLANITRKVNGRKMLHAAEREAASNRALSAFKFIDWS